MGFQVRFSLFFLASILLSACSSGGEQSASAVIPSTGIPSTGISSGGNLTPLEKAIASGDVRLGGSEADFIAATLQEIDVVSTLFRDAKIQIFNLNADGSAKIDGSSLTSINWSPTWDSALFKPKQGETKSLLKTNSVFTAGKAVLERDIALIGKRGATRYLLFGGNPMATSNTTNAQMDSFLENSLSWVTNRQDLKQKPFRVVMSHLAQSYWFPHEIDVRAWMNNHYAGQVSYNAANACDSVNLESCLNTPTDLLIVSQAATATDDIPAVISAIEKAMAKGIPVVYLQYDGNKGALLNAMLKSVFAATYEVDNYWKRLQLQAYNPAVNINVAPTELQQLKTLFQNFQTGNYNYNLSACTNSTWSAVCPEEPLFQSEFWQATQYVSGIVNKLDKTKQDIFNSNRFRLDKLLILSADKMRESIVYPMDKNATPINAFLKSLYADHAVYNYRSINYAQPDMGNFSRSDFSAITPITKTVKLTSKKNFRSTGVYALPGQSVTITRNDNSAVGVKVFINTLRAEATQAMSVPNKYNRPKRLRTVEIPIDPYETITITSPYGGPIQLAFNTNGLPVDITFSQVGEHPYWASSADDVTFAQKMADAQYDWAEIATSGFEVHSTFKKMQESIAMPAWGSASALANATQRYISNYPHVLAGFQGVGIDVVPEIHDFATQNGWTIDVIDTVKHMNADQAACGYGCSGNPYDAFWAFSPTGHGDLHELGHGLEKKKMLFSGWELHSITNPYSYYSKSRYNANTNGNPTCQSLPFRQVFNALQASVNAVDPNAYLQTNLWPGTWSNQVLLTIQAMMSAQKAGVLQNGWHLLARLHMLEREFKRATASDVLWTSKRLNLGFNSYLLTEAKAISNNDWMVIAMSYATGRDYRDYLNMWGITFSAKANAQVASFLYPVVPREYFISTGSGYCSTDIYGTQLSKTTLPIDGYTAW
jgi:hypothetical protein